MGLIQNNSCRRCQLDGVNETLEHILCTCPALARTRLRVLGWISFRDFAEVSRCDMRKLIDFARESGVFDLYDPRQKFLAYSW